MFHHTALRIACWLAVSLALSSPLAACEIKPLATVPLTWSGQALVMPVTINDIEAHFILDTGAERSIVSEAASLRLGLERDPWVGTTMRGIGGIVRRPNAKPHSLAVAGIQLVRRTLSRDTSLAVMPLPRNVTQDGGVDGLLGRDYLSLFDLDLDISSQRLTLQSVVGCAGRFLPWRMEYVATPIMMPLNAPPIITAYLDGHPLRAMLDTGAALSLLTAPGMHAMGLMPDDLAEDPPEVVNGLGPHAILLHRHRFQNLRIGDARLAYPGLWVGIVRIAPMVDVLIGMDWLTGRHIWFSFATRQIFVAL
jgi:hypothetical protein